jgi:hypothetical protein
LLVSSTRLILRTNPSGLICGADPGLAVTPEYASLRTFTGKIYGMTGDVNGADALAQQYFDARAKAKDPVIEYRKAQWAWISGRRKSANWRQSWI